jgi:hypothetical protein
MCKYTIIINEVIIEMELNKYERAMELDGRQFKLLVGIMKQTAVEMVKILHEAYKLKHKRRGRHAKLSIEVMLMMALEYWRQYVTFFELGFEYGVAESTAHDIVVWVENTLINSGKFSLPGKKALLADDEIEIVLVDVTESPIERPKKNKSNTIQEKRSSTP